MYSLAWVGSSSIPPAAFLPKEFALHLGISSFLGVAWHIRSSCTWRQHSSNGNMNQMIAWASHSSKEEYSGASSMVPHRDPCRIKPHCLTRQPAPEHNLLGLAFPCPFLLPHSAGITAQSSPSSGSQALLWGASNGDRHMGSKRTILWESGVSLGQRP